MTHRNDIGGEVTRYLDDIVVIYSSLEPGYAKREIDLSMSLSRIHWVYACVLIIMIMVRGVIGVIGRIGVGEVVIVEIVIEKRREGVEIKTSENEQPSHTPIH